MHILLQRQCKCIFEEKKELTQNQMGVPFFQAELLEGIIEICKNSIYFISGASFPETALNKLAQLVEK